MASRQTRSASISIPANAVRNIEDVIGIPFNVVPGPRPRLASSASRTAATASPERPLIGRSAAPISPVRSLSGGYAAALGRGPASHSPPVPVFEPRIIRPTATPGHTADPSCVPASLTRARRPSIPRLPTGPAPISASSMGRTPAPLQTPQVAATAAPQAPPFQRPAYLEQSALRDLLYTDAPPSRSSNPLTSELAHHGHTSWVSSPPPAPYPYLRRDTTPLVDTDDDSTASPPPPSLRGTPAPAPPSALLTTPVLRLPTRWNEQDRHPSLTVSSDGRELTFFGPSCIGERDSAAARANNPIPPACGIYYYEVEILQKGNKGHISIGFSSPEVRLSRLPGWEKHSWGYHADDGWAFPGHKDGNAYGPTFDTGDVIGCGIDFSQNKAFYTKNGAFLGMVFENVGKGIDLYPSIGLRHSSESVRVNFGHSPFKYAIDDHVHAQRNQVWANIQSTRIDWDLLNGKENQTSEDGENAAAPVIPKGGALEEEQMKSPMRKLVLAYLAHHGYAKTARAFQAQCEGTRSPAVQDDPSMETDDTPTASSSSSTSLLDSEFDLHSRIEAINSVLKGDIDAAVAVTRKHHPTVLEREQGLMLFKLRCRKFVELILQASEALKKVQAEQAEEQERIRAAEKEAQFERDGMDGTGAMDVDDPSPEAHHTPSDPSLVDIVPPSPVVARDVVRRPSSVFRGSSATPSSVIAKTALHTAIEYGQTLEADYKTDLRPEVRSHLKRTFGVVAYADPLAAGGEVAEMAGQEARARLAHELNQAILESQGKPAHPALETLYRQTAACVVQLGLLGVGSAAFADMSKEFLDA
ncbi:SPRY-domain-containing protein [Trametopsis cervina]|nr:SPRY-domain-containing protein [Trametopsis cervina]